MRTLLVLSSFLIWLAGPQSPSFEVQWVGEMKRVMRDGDLRASIDLRTLAKSKNLYALGPLENLRGEVTIWNLNPAIASIQEDRIQIDAKWDFRACFLVYAKVTDWKEIPIPADVKDEGGLEEFVRKSALEHRIDVERPYPFLIKARPKELQFHVMNHPAGTEHTPESHQRAKTKFTLRGEPVKMLGFYSDKHHGIFTHHGINTHLHVLTDDGKQSGHVDSLILGGEAMLSLPERR